MPKVNSNLLKLKKNYFFNEIEKKVLFKKKEGCETLNLGIGDITQPLASSVIEAMQIAADEMKSKETLQGYGPSDGYVFLREKIKKNDYLDLDINSQEIFIASGTKYTSANIGDLFSENNMIGICDPAYPVYVDANIMNGRKNNIYYLPLLEKNNFEPQIPEITLDIIYLCSPNNPTGIALSNENLKKWVDYARKNNSLIIFDGAYEAFITSKNTPHSIYEIEGAKEVAIEMRSFSKTAGFTSLRCAYMVIPQKLKTHEDISIHDLWKRYINTKLGAVSYPIQKGAEAIFSEKGKAEVKNIIRAYLDNTKLLFRGLRNLGLTIYGGKNSPYIWCKCNNNLSSWEFFDHLLKRNIVTIPGSGFGKSGEGFVRFSGFANKEIIEKALDNLKDL